MSENNLPWMNPGWFEQAGAWIKAQLAARNVEMAGPVETVRIRPWSAVLTALTARGRVYFKACAPILSFEPALTGTLAHWQPENILRVLAVDRARSWLLMPDEGPMLRERIKSPGDLFHWETILPRLAGLQQQAAGRVDELLAVGLPDRRLSSLPAQFADLLEQRESLLIDQEDGLTSEQYARLASLLKTFEAMCEELAGYGLPETLHHEDFHDGNILVTGERYAFSDWGESCLAHPFFTMLVTLRSIAYRFDWPYGAAEHDFYFAPDLIRLRDLYLDRWTHYAPRETLIGAYHIAWKVAMVNRAMTWQRVLAAAPPEDRKAMAYTVPAWLNEFLDSTQA